LRKARLPRLDKLKTLQLERSLAGVFKEEFVVK
jgi:hypothetical protein